MIPDYFNYSIQDFKGTSWQPNLNLSWLERRSGVQLWLSGVIDEKPTAKTLRPIRLFGDEIGQKVYVSEGKYVIIESKLVVYKNEEDKREYPEENFEEEKTSDYGELHSVTIADLEETLKEHCMNTSSSSLRYCFRMKALETETEKTDNTVEKKVHQQGDIIQVNVPKEDLPEVKIGQTISKEGLRIFFTKNTSSISLFVFDSKEKDSSYFKVSLQLESHLIEAFLTKKPDQNEKFAIFLVDQYFNIYLFKYSQENELKINKICLKNNKEENPEQEGTREGVFKIQKQFHHGLSPTSQIENLVIFEGRTFYLVNLETLQFSTKELIYINYDVVYDWTAYDGRLYVFENNDIVSYQLNAINPAIQRHGSLRPPGIFSWRYGKYARRWISMNSCYTILAEATPLDSGQKITVNISIISTEQQVKEVFSFYHCFENAFVVKLDNFLDLEEYEDRIKEVAEHMNVKIEDNTVIVQTSKRSLFVNLEAYRKPVAPDFAGQMMAFSTERNFKVLETKEEDKKKGGEKVVKREKPQHVVNLMNSIHDNKNHTQSKNQKPKKNWSGCPKKTEGKEEREQDRVARQKGDKYYKNVRHKEHEEKLS